MFSHSLAESRKAEQADSGTCLSNVIPRESTEFSLFFSFFFSPLLLTNLLPIDPTLNVRAENTISTQCICTR